MIPWIVMSLQEILLTITSTNQQHNQCNNLEMAIYKHIRITYVKVRYICMILYTNMIKSKDDASKYNVANFSVWM